MPGAFHNKDSQWLTSVVQTVVSSPKGKAPAYILQQGPETLLYTGAPDRGFCMGSWAAKASKDYL